MSLRELNYFVAIGEAGSITKASAHLRIAQPALTRHLKHLETRVGARLIQRQGRGIVLTDAGRHFLGRIKPLLAQLRSAETELSHLTNGRPIHMTMGLPSSLASLADRFIERAAAAQPPVSLQIVDGWSRFVVDWVLSGQLDFGIVYDHNCDDRVLELTPLAGEEHYLVGQAEDPLLADGSIRLVEVAQLPLILPSRHHALRCAADRHFEAIGQVVQPVVELDSVPTIKKLIERGVGYSILSESEMRFNSAPALAAAKIVEPSFIRTLSLVRRRDAADRDVIGALAAEIGLETASILAEGLWGVPAPVSEGHFNAAPILAEGNGQRVR